MLSYARDRSVDLRFDSKVHVVWFMSQPWCTHALQEEHNNLPARVSIISLPDKQELRSKSLFSVHEVHMYWQQQGKYLAVHVRLFHAPMHVCHLTTPQTQLVRSTLWWRVSYRYLPTRHLSVAVTLDNGQTCICCPWNL